MNIKRAKEEIENSIRAYLACDTFGGYRIPSVRQRPIVLIGPPGIGKTQIMEQIAAETGIGLVAYTITHHTRQSALGLPFIEHHTFGGETYAVTEYTMSEILASVYRQIERTGIKEGILFLDEINCISETLTPMMLQFLQCKTFGNQRLPEGWIIVAAGNPPEYNHSVHEFDIVTLDRVKRIDVSEDYTVWKEYAYKRGMHGAILAYLDIHKEHFYRIEMDADGLRFATARGWEDLSELLQTYESLGLTVDRAVVEQYIQLPRIAKDFANYLALYDKYRRVYRIDEILDGTWERVRATELATAPFDEKLSVIGLLLARLSEETRIAWQLDRQTDGLHATLLRIKNALSGVPVVQALQAALEETRKMLRLKRDAGLADREAQHDLQRQLARLESYATALTDAQPKDDAAAFEYLRTLFAQDVATREQQAERTSAQLDAAFTFLEAGLGDSQELVMFATELTANFYTSWFIQNFGCEAYFRHNRALLFDDTQSGILAQIEQARANDVTE